MEREYAIDLLYRGQSRTRGPDEVISGLAARQHGVVARRQLLALGIGPKAIDHRVDRSRLHVLHRGVYAAGHTVLTQQARWMAAVLAAGPGAVLSHRSAAALWRIRHTASARIEITAPRKLHPRKNLLPHCAVLPADETTVNDGIPVTTPARTLLDLADVIPPNQLDRALNEAEIRRLEGPQRLLERQGAV
jgi:predicted transcriptional regulator of viral defense system